MKKYLKLQIDSGVCDLPDKGITVDITKRINAGLTPAGGGLERSINLPVTKNNQDIFSRWDYAAENNQLGVEFKNGTIICNGIVLADGQAQQTAVKNDQYEVTIYDGNADWISRLSGLRLRDLDWTVAEHDLTAGNILTGYNETVGSNGWCYIIAKTKDSVTVPAGYGADTGKYAHNIYNSVPALFVRDIIDKIFSYLGLTYSSNFFKNTVLADGLIMPIPLPERYGADFSEDYLNVRGEFSGVMVLDWTVNLGIGSFILTSQTQTPTIGANPLVLSILSYIPPVLSFQYTAKATGYYHIIVSMVVDNIANNGVFSIAAWATAPASTAYGQFQLTPANNGDTVTFDQVVYLVEGEALQLFPSVTISIGYMEIISAQVTITGEAEIKKDTPINFKYLLSDWTCTDFLKGVGEMFNLHFETSVGTGDVTIEPLDDYLYTDVTPSSQINTGFLVGVNDWRYKEDLSRERNDSFNKIPNKTVFEYKADSSDKTISVLNEGTDLTLLSSQYTRPLTKFREGITKRTNSFFAATISVYEYQIKTDTSVITPLIPLFWAENFAQQQTFETPITTYAPRILWFGGQRVGLDGYARLVNEAAFTEVQIPAAFMVNYNDITGLDQCLSYGDQIVNGITVQGLTKRFYLKSLARTTRNRLRSVFFYLNDIDASLLSFRKRIFADGLWWVLQEMRAYNPLNPSATQCELLLDVAETQDDIDSITSSVIPNQTGYLQWQKVQ